MRTLPPLTWEELARALREKFQDALSHTADSLQDTLTDVGMTDEEAAATLRGRAVPPVQPAPLVTALQPVFEETIGKVAKAINDAPPEAAFAASEEQIWNLFVALAETAFQKGWQMRFDALANQLFPPSQSNANWAQRYRRLQAEQAAHRPV